MDQLSLQSGNWQALHEWVYPIRHEVFVLEQGVPAELELDEGDLTALHFLVRDPNGYPVATGRLLPDGHIGRVAVRAKWRQQGVGMFLMRAIIEAARTDNPRELWLHAQISAQHFYASFGFTTVGEIFMEAGIAHLEMRKSF
jgi:predicted GNAT family N-acyltransferase